MGRYIEIKKTHAINNLYHYEVFSPDYPDIDKFYLKIDSDKKSVYFSNISDYSDKIFIFIFDNKDHKFDNITWLPLHILGPVLYKVKEAIDQDIFNEYISFAS